MKTPCPKIVTWHSTNAPPRFAWRARFLFSSGELSPLEFSVSEDRGEGAIIAAAQKWWEEHASDMPEDIASAAPTNRAGKGQNFVNTVWVVNKKGENERVPASSLQLWLDKGYQRGRSWKG